ncbi:pentapeptide repeat-containing protein [Ktedonosporobacter rubrisoli]|uniref:Pentapeptide repeat-containing protein n=1 Tax=Ktedonosporobacter rubrisoli TaxID=2509675 RepID=A0A4P6K2G0_KTERU|nr:pentapeptide repeat-containing protein [Ktedonosporobacter rubrisoli]QBD81890.1 pentapeptide repeat-containing protein [Ktedonosporobacter rubrisoli]
MPERQFLIIGIACASLLFFSAFIVCAPAAAASLPDQALTVASATPQARPTEDAEVTALEATVTALKAQVAQQADQDQHTWDNWLWSNGATVVSGVLSTLVVVIGALFGLWRWRVDRRDAQEKELKDKQEAQEREIKDRQEAREKMAEARFQAAVEGLGSEKEGARIGAATLLRTFLRPGYEQFYVQTFDLAAAHLRLPRSVQLPENTALPQPLTTLSQALIVVFKEAFPMTRQMLQDENSQAIDATGVQLDMAYLSEADFKGIWMPQASLKGARLSEADLREARLFEADLYEADLREADLSEADLREAKLFKTDLRVANLSEVDLRGADLREARLILADLRRADLREARLILADLRRADLREAKLFKADLREARLFGADLREANLSEVDLREARLFRANLHGADLREANLGETDLGGADLSGTNIESARFLKNTNLQGAQGLTEEQLAACKAKGALIDELVDDTTATATQLPAPTLCRGIKYSTTTLCAKKSNT